MDPMQSVQTNSKGFFPFIIIPCLNYNVSILDQYPATLSKFATFYCISINCLSLALPDSCYFSSLSTEQELHELGPELNQKPSYLRQKRK